MAYLKNFVAGQRKGDCLGNLVQDTRTFAQTWAVLDMKVAPSRSTASPIW